MTSPGAFVSKQEALCVLGNAITSLILVVPVRSITILSNPKAIPPCGGQPEDKADNKKPNFSSASSDEIPSI